MWLVVTIGAGCDASTPLERGAGTRDEAGATEPGDGAGTISAPQGSPNGIDHVLSTGQSNAISFAGREVLSREQAFGNVMFDRGVMTAAGCDADGCTRFEEPAAIAPLVEGDVYFDYPVETMSSGLANQIARTAQARGASPSILVSVHGRSGNTYECLRKGGCSFLEGRGYVKAFDEAMKQIAAGRQLARAGGRPYRVTAITAVHGESDHYVDSFPLDGTDGAARAIATYADALVEWQRDYEESIREATGQTWTIPLLVSQMSNWNDRPNSAIPIRQLEAHDRAPGRVVLVGPTYFLPFASDCIHFTSDGQRRLGEYFAKAYARVVLEGGRWEPVRPAAVSFAGDVVTVRFVVPKPPLVLDTTSVTDPGDDGFEVVDSSGVRLGVASVAVTAPDTVSIRLATPGATPARLRYAFTARPNTCPGPALGPRGNLRDSDDTPSNYGYRLYNWAVHFDVAIR